jgi:hypothetical protein
MFVPDYFDEFALHGIRVQEFSLMSSEPNFIRKRDLHALNSAFLLYNIDPATQIDNFLVRTFLFLHSNLQLVFLRRMTSLGRHHHCLFTHW